MSHRYLRRLRDRLSPHRTVVSVDLPGYGGVPKPGRDVDVAAMGQAIVVLLRRLGLGPVVLVGHSMGAQWVVETARQDPAAAAAVVVIGPVTDSRHRSVPAQAAALALDTLLESPRTNAIVVTDYVRCGPRWYLAQVRHMIAYPIEQRIAGLEMPLVVIRGRRDPIAGERWCRSLVEAAPLGRFVEIPRGAHVVQESRPDLTAAAILVAGVGGRSVASFPAGHG